ncbi:MAG: YXWGXW repeat-containing protein, partial [Planctomycetes bacterium]|nr:YXWGXW repeat-containing protein [Planctomycetota bacterium]
MRRSILPLGILGLLTMFALASLGKSQQPQPRPGVDPDNPIEVQPRGAIHEAFAQPFDGKAQPGPLVPKEPPPPIPEEPPEQRPEGDNVQWFSGYWAWDAQLGDFVWISGVHRVPPQERTFVPGYWQQTPEGWRWVHGFWADAKQQAIPYTPEPPAPLDNSPSMPPPDDDSVYIPGSWNYRDDRFVWRPGYYAPAQLGRMWTPPRFLWTPGGYIFISGFWDCPLEDRGLAYANVYFTRPLWRDPSWRYRPSLVISLGSFWDSTFVMDSQFYCGDYYDPFYSRLGYRPWYTG